MRRELLMAVVSILAFAGLSIAGAYAWHDSHWGRRIDPIVSTDWLEDNLDREGLVIIDIRDPGAYVAGHIPGSINEPFVTAFDPTCGPSSAWITGKRIDGDQCLWLQLPEKGALFNTIGNLGITKHSLVVIVTAPNPGEPPYYGLANATRVADTLIYAGIKNMAVLDGGYPKWVAEGKEITATVPDVEPIPYYAKVDKEMFVSIEYVRRHIRSAVIIDARDAEVYFGAAIEPFAPKEGHIPNARSLPTPWMWAIENESYIYKDKETLKAMASGVIGRHGRHWHKEIIVYCGVGGYASAWWFVLTQVLGYEEVRIFDGSAQEWVMKNSDMVPYEWE